MARETRKTKDGRYVLRPGEYERVKKRGFEYKYRDKYGHQHTLGAVSLKELREKEKSVQRDKLDGISTHKQRQTLNDYYDLWKHQSRLLKSNTFSNYCWMYDSFVSQKLGKMKINEIKESDIREFYNDLLDSGMAVTTMDSIQTILHQVIDMAVRDDAIRRNPSDDALTKLKKMHPREKKEALTPEELARFRDVIKDTVWYPIFEVMSWTGLRVGEVCALTWDDIDYKENVIHVNKTLVYYKDIETGEMIKTINTTKTPASFRDIPLNKHIIDALEYQKKNCPDCRDRIDGFENFIFATRFHSTHSQSTLNRALKRIGKLANSEKSEVVLPYLYCHLFRRTYATNLARAGVSIPVMMSLLGHTDYETTVSVYTDVQRDMKEKGDEQLRAWLNGQIVAKDEATRKELTEYRQLAIDIINVTKNAHDDMDITGGIIPKKLMKKVNELGLSYDDIYETWKGRQNSSNRSQNKSELKSES